MTEPCTIEQLEASAKTLRAFAIASGRRLEMARVNGVKMHQIRHLEAANRAAWARYYAVGSRLHEAYVERR